MSELPRSRRVTFVAGFLLLAAYAVPLFTPLAPEWPVPRAADTPFWSAVYPGMPPWWVLSRLLCLLAGTGLVTFAMRDRLPISLSLGLREPASPRPRAGPAAWWWCAFLVASGLLVCAPFADGFDIPAASVYLSLVFVPAALLLSPDRQRVTSALRKRLPQLGALLVVPALWLAWGVATAWRTHAAASVNDGWIFLKHYVDLIEGREHLLGHVADFPFPNAIAFLDGISLLGPGKFPVSFVGTQISHLFWGSFNGLLLGALATALTGLPAAIVTQAIFLFCPLMLSSLFSPIHLFVIIPFVTTALPATALALHRAPTGGMAAAALAAFAAIFGFTLHAPSLAPAALLICAFVVVSLRVRPIPWQGVAIAALVFGYTALPGLPDPETLSVWRQALVPTAADAVRVVAVFFGQRSPYLIGEALDTPPISPSVVPMQALLGLFALPRSPLRLLGDSLFDPFGATLMALGIGFAVQRMRREPVPLAFVLLAAAGTLAAFSSTGNKLSPLRLMPAAVPLAILAGFAFDMLRRRFVAGVSPAKPTAIATALAVAGGVYLSASVNPRILPASWMSIAMEAVGGQSAQAHPVFLRLDEKQFTFLQIEPVLSMLPAQPIGLRSRTQFCGTDAGTFSFEGDARSLYVWNPGLEQHVPVSCLICHRWPGAVFYELFDAAGLYRAFAVSPKGAGWRPRIGPDRWTVSTCNLTPNWNAVGETLSAPCVTPVQPADWWRPAPELDGLRCATQAHSPRRISAAEGGNG